MADDQFGAIMTAAAETARGLTGDDYRAYNDLAFFSDYVMGYDNTLWVAPSPLLLNIYDHLQNSNNNMLILGPRYSAKSQGWVNYVLWTLGRNPLHRFMLVFAAKEMQGFPFSEQIANVIAHNERYRRIFGDLMPEGNTRWTFESRTIRRKEPPGGLKDPSISIVGFGSAVPSRRADTVIVDDIVTQKNAYSPTIQDQIERFVFQSLTPIIGDGRLIVVGSQWSPIDLYSRLIKKWGMKVPEIDYTLDLDYIVDELTKDRELV